MTSINIPLQILPEVTNKKIEYKTTDSYILRYFIKRVDGKFTEVAKSEFSQYKNNPYFEKVIIKWYIRGTRNFVISQNTNEINLADERIKGIRNLIVNPLQLYQGEI